MKTRLDEYMERLRASSSLFGNDVGFVRSGPEVEAGFQQVKQAALADPLWEEIRRSILARGYTEYETAGYIRAMQDAGLTDPLYDAYYGYINRGKPVEEAVKLAKSHIKSAIFYVRMIQMQEDRMYQEPGLRQDILLRTLQSDLESVLEHRIGWSIPSYNEYVAPVWRQIRDEVATIDFPESGQAATDFYASEYERLRDKYLTILEQNLSAVTNMSLVDQDRTANWH